MSKAEISSAEKAHEDLVTNLRTTELEVDRHKALIREKQRTKKNLEDDLQAERLLTEKSKSAESETRQSLEQAQAERDELARKLTECEKLLEGEEAVLSAAKAAKKGLFIAQTQLADVHEELEVLSSDVAKKVALDVEGGELPTDVVPAPVVERTLEPIDPQALWGKDPDHPPSDEVRQALQSQAVLVALQRSLSVRAAELRETLRQLGFAHSATRRTQELCKVATGDQEDFAVKTRELQSEHDSLVAEREVELGTLARLHADHQELEQKHAALTEQLDASTGASGKLQEERQKAKEQLEAAKLEHEELVHAHEDAGREVEARQTAIQEHPEEVGRRTTAAEKLARMADEQTQQALEQLQQTQEELIFFQQAQRALQQAYVTLGEHLEAEKTASASLKAEHERQNMDLEALARNYMAVLPPLPGLDKLAEEPTPPASPEPSDAAPAPATAAAEPREAEKEALGRTPAPPLQPRHLDPTGLGILSAGGRLVLSL